MTATSPSRGLELFVQAVQLGLGEGRLPRPLRCRDGRYFSFLWHFMQPPCALKAFLPSWHLPQVPPAYISFIK